MIQHKPNSFFPNSFSLKPFFTTLTICWTLINGIIATESSAYIPPSQFIIKSWVGKHKGVKTIRVKSTITAYENGHPGLTSFSETSVFNLNLKTLRSSVSDSSHRKLYSRKIDLNATPLITKALFSLDPHELATSLREKNIKVRSEAELLELKTETERMQAEVEFLGRLDPIPDPESSSPQSSPSSEEKSQEKPPQKIAWIIGAHPATSLAEGLGGAQAWFEKDTFIPLRLIYSKSAHHHPGEKASDKHSDESDLYDFNLQNYRRYGNDFFYPGKIYVQKKGGAILFSVKTTEVLVNSTSPEQSISSDTDTQHDKKSNHFTPLGESSPEGLKELIQSYYDLFRST